MELFSVVGLPVERVDPEHFTGGGSLVRIPEVCATPPVNAYLVTFEPGSRTDWHSHSGPQLLLVTDGRCRLQRRGGRIEHVDAGGIASIAPGEEHWHGATPEAPVTHLALNIDLATDWLERVTDAEYQVSE